MRQPTFPLLLLLLFVADLATFAQTEQTSAPETKTSEASLEATKILLTPDANGMLSEEQIRQLAHVVAEKIQENDRRQRDYTYIERDVERRLDGKGQVKSTETETYEVMDIYGEQVSRLIEKNDKPLSAKEAATEEEKIQKITDKRKNESESDRRKREAKEAQEREEGRKFVNEVADAYYFKLIGSEEVGGRETWVMDAEPRPDFVPKMKQSKFLSKFRGRFWVDKTDLQLAKMDVEAIDTVTFGLFLARLHKDAHFTLEQTRVNNEVWLPQHLAFNIDARIALLKNYRIAGEQTFRDYRKFRSSSRILGYQELKQP